MSAQFITRHRLNGPTEEVEFQKHADGTSTTSIKDHTGQEVTLAWQADTGRDQNKIPLFPFQVYVLQSATASIRDPAFPSKFVHKATGTGEFLSPDADYRFEIYRGSFGNSLDCVDHQRAEVEWRNRNGIWPQMVERWSAASNMRFAAFIVAIESDAWEVEGFVSVNFQYSNRLGDLVPPSCSTGAFRERDIEYLPRLLREKWISAGHTWTQLELARRNDGWLSPALHPAIDPAAHEDAEHEIAALPALADSDTADDDTEAAGDDEEEEFTSADLWHSISRGCDGLGTEYYVDLSGTAVQSVWSTQHNGTRSTLLVTLYCGAAAFFNTAALFFLLNRKSLQGVPVSSASKYRSMH